MASPSGLRFSLFITAMATAALLWLLPGPARAVDWDAVKGLGGRVLEGTAAEPAGPTEPDIAAGLKEALSIAVRRSVDDLGRPGGYLESPEVRIPLPDELSFAAKTARFLGQDELVDDFTASMNHAAEQAVPETVDIFSEALSAMTVEDARGILDGPDDAATRYFERTSSGALEQRIRPIVAESMADTGVTRTYNALTKGVASTAEFVGLDAVRLEEYVTARAVDGLFLVMAREEAEIRNDPVQWTTELLKRVFGSAR